MIQLNRTILAFKVESLIQHIFKRQEDKDNETAMERERERERERFF